MKIQHKRSNQLDGGTAKEPSEEFMEYGELAVNFNEADPAIFLKDSDDNIVRIAGAGAIGSIEIPEAGSDPHQPGTTDDRYVEITGDTMTGQLALPGGGGATEALQKQEIEALISSSDVIVQDGSVSVPDVANYSEGQLWWNSDAEVAKLFVLYNDPAGGGGSDAGGLKWIEASPMPLTPDIFPDLDDGTNQPGTLDDRYLSIDADAGDQTVASTGTTDFAGDVTVGDDKITLDATNGNASFAEGRATVNATHAEFRSAQVAGNNNAFVRMRTRSDSGQSDIFLKSLNTNASTESAIDLRYGDDKTFSVANNGALNIGTDLLNNTPNVTLNPDGSATFAGGNFSIGGSAASGFFKAERTFSGQANPDSLQFNVSTGEMIRGVLNGGTSVFSINRDGSAEFAGVVSIKGGASISTGNRAQAIIINDGIYGEFLETNITSVNYSGSGAAQTPIVFGGVSANGAGYTEWARVTPTGIGFHLEADNPDNYTVSTIEYEEQEELTPYIPAVEAVYGEPPLITPAVDPVVGPLGNVLVEGTEAIYGEAPLISEAVPAVEATYQTVTKTREIRTYNGPTLDVKERLTKADNALIALKTAAAAATDFASLQTAIATALADI